MRRTLQRRTVYAATILAIVAIVAGYAVASFTIGSFTSTPGQSGASASPTSAPGVSFPAEQVILAGTSTTTSGACSAPDASLNTRGSADTLATSGQTVLCLNTGGTSVSPAGYGVGDFIQVVEVAFSGPGTLASTYYGIQVYLNGAAGTGTANIGLPTNPVSAYVFTGPSWTSSSSVTEWLTFDMTSSGTSSIITVNVLVTDCGTSACTF